MKEEIRMILNLTNHNSTVDQKKEGVVELKDIKKDVVKSMLTFDRLPTPCQLETRAQEIAKIAENAFDKDYGAPIMERKAMVGGAPFFMRSLENALKGKDIIPVYAFSKRESIEETLEDGKVIKKQVFKHLGFIEEFPPDDFPKYYEK